jgi:hypothetical protein
MGCRICWANLLTIGSSLIRINDQSEHWFEIHSRKSRRGMLLLMTMWWISAKHKMRFSLVPSIPFFPAPANLIGQESVTFITKGKMFRFFGILIRGTAHETDDLHPWR